MRFHANRVSTPVSGDYYHVRFEAIEDSLDPGSLYLEPISKIPSPPVGGEG